MAVADKVDVPAKSEATKPDNPSLSSSASTAAEKLHQNAYAPSGDINFEPAALSGGSTQSTNRAELDQVRALNAAATGAPEPSLPKVALTDSSSGGLLSGIEHWAGTALTVAKDLGKGAINEAEEHTGQLVEDFAIGAVIGAAVVLAPEIAIPAMLAYTGYQAIENRDKIVDGVKEFGNDVAVVNGASSTPGDAAKAEASLEGFGAFGAQVAAGVLGSVAGGAAMGMTMARLSAQTLTPDVPPPPPPVELPPPEGTPAPPPGPEVSAPAGTLAKTPGAEVSTPAGTTAPAPGTEISTPAGTAAPTPGAEISKPAGTPPPGAEVARQGSPEATEATVAKSQVTTPGDLRSITNPDSFSAEVEKLWQAHQAGDNVEFQVSKTNIMTDASGNPLYTAADGSRVVKVSAGEGQASYIDMQGKALDLSDTQIAALKPLDQGRLLGQDLARLDPENWHPNLVSPRPGLAPEPPTGRFTAVQPTDTFLSNDGAPLKLSTSINLGDERVPIYSPDGKPLLNLDGTPQTTSEIPSGSQLSFGSLYHDGQVQSVDPEASVWATTQDGNLIRFTERGQVRGGIDASSFEANKSGVFGQPVGGQVVLVRAGSSVDPDLINIPDAYPNKLADFNRNMILEQPQGTALGNFVKPPIVSPHYDVPEGMSVTTTMRDGGTQLARGSGYNDPEGFLWNPDSGYPNLQKVLGQTGVPQLPDGSLDIHSAQLVVASRGWNTQAGTLLKQYQEAAAH